METEPEVSCAIPVNPLASSEEVVQVQQAAVAVGRARLQATAAATTAVSAAVVMATHPGHRSAAVHLLGPGTH